MRIVCDPGTRFGRWTVDATFVPSGGGPTMANVTCDCGSRRAVSMNSLRTGRSVSCGCYARECARVHMRALVTTHGLSSDAAHEAWKAMKGRCSNPRNRKFPEYGGRGITVCQEWKDDFAAFLRDVGPRPSPIHTIDRWPDNNGNYEPGNVRWATPTEQANNRRPRRWGVKPKAPTSTMEASHV